MKKIIRLFLLLLLIVSCDNILESEPEHYFISVRIVDLSEGQPVPLAGNLIGIKSGEKRLFGGVTDADGWFTSNSSISKSDFVVLDISDKMYKKNVKVENLSPSNYSEMFVKNKSDFKTNIPALGYHIWTKGLK